MESAPNYIMFPRVILRQHVISKNNIFQFPSTNYQGGSVLILGSCWLPLAIRDMTTAAKGALALLASVSDGTHRHCTRSEPIATNMLQSATWLV